MLYIVGPHICISIRCRCYAQLGTNPYLCGFISLENFPVFLLVVKIYIVPTQNLKIQSHWFQKRDFSLQRGLLNSVKVVVTVKVQLGHDFRPNNVSTSSTRNCHNCPDIAHVMRCQLIVLLYDKVRIECMVLLFVKCIFRQVIENTVKGQRSNLGEFKF